MATTSPQTATPTAAQPPFKRVAQTESFDCWLAAVATLVARTLADVKQVAVEKFKLPKNGPYPFMDDVLIAKLLAHWSLTGTVWKESTGIASLPDVCIGLIDYNPETEIGRHVVFVRQRDDAGKVVQEWLLDPAHWIATDRQVRTDVKAIPIAWYIGVTPMRPAGK
jgi:hypothetical protein